MICEFSFVDKLQDDEAARWDANPIEFYANVEFCGSVTETATCTFFAESEIANAL